jgi:hypothetical protein
MPAPNSRLNPRPHLASQHHHRRHRKSHRGSTLCEKARESEPSHKWDPGPGGILVFFELEYRRFGPVAGYV